MELHPYLTFDGTAREAITFYAGVFDQPLPEMMTFGGMPDQDWVTDANRDRIAHANIKVANVTLMVSDSGGSDPFPGHHGMSINISLPDVDKGRTLFNALADGGSVTMPFEPSFWAKGFGSCRDKFGVSWMVNVE